MSYLTVQQRIDNQIKARNEFTKELCLAALTGKNLDDVYKSTVKYDNDWFFINFSKSRISKQTDKIIEIAYEIYGPTLWCTRDDSNDPEELKQLELKEFFKTTENFPGKMLYETYDNYIPGLTRFRGNGETYEDSPDKVCVVQFEI